MESRGKKEQAERELHIMIGIILGIGFLIILSNV
jgi:hypothetical protein